MPPPCWYADAVAGKGVTLYNCFDFVDGTIAPICRPILNERVVYSLIQRVHSVKFQSVVLPRQCTILYESDLLNQLQCLTWFNNQSLLLYFI